MPTYNANRFVRTAVESILAQTFEDFEFIIVDDCSTDGSSEILRQYAERDRRIRVLTNTRNLDFVRSRNRGIAEAGGVFVANMDSDDVALPTRLAEQYAFMTSNPAVGVCGAAVILIDENDCELGIRRYRADDRDLRARLFLFNPFAQPVTMIRRDVLDDTGRNADKVRAAAEMRRLVVAAEPADDRDTQRRHQARRPTHPAVHQIGLETVDERGQLAPPKEAEPALQHVRGERHPRCGQPLAMDGRAGEHGHLLQARCLQARHHVGGVGLRATIGAARHDVQDAHAVPSAQSWQCRVSYPPAPVERQL